MGGIPHSLLDVDVVSWKDYPFSVNSQIPGASGWEHRAAWHSPHVPYGVTVSHPKQESKILNRLLLFHHHNTCSFFNSSRPSTVIQFMSKQTILQSRLCYSTTEYSATGLLIINVLIKCIQCFARVKKKKKAKTLIISTFSNCIKSLLKMLWICIYKRSTKNQEGTLRNESLFNVSLLTKVKQPTIYFISYGIKISLPTCCGEIACEALNESICYWILCKTPGTQSAISLFELVKISLLEVNANTGKVPHGWTLL